MGRFDGRTVVVVGAGAIGAGWSNGKACAVTYAREGATVFCIDYLLPRAEETAHIIAGEGGRAVALQADETDEAALGAAVEVAVEQTGRLDVMHNNVGAGGSPGAPDKVSLKEFQRDIAQNLTTAFLGTRLAVPVMRRGHAAAAAE